MGEILLRKLVVVLCVAWFDCLTDALLFGHADPHELHNLASQASPALKAELHQMVLEQFGCRGTKCT